ncbi:MAG TPA: hypothetical protein VF185_00565 [Patescibacteria group bacterium]
MFKEFGNRVGRASRVGFVIRMIDGAIEIASREDILGNKNQEQTHQAVTTYLKKIYNVAPKMLIGGDLEIGDLQDAFILQVKDKRRDEDILKSVIEPLVETTINAKRLKDGVEEHIVELLDKTIDSSIRQASMEDTEKVIVVKRLINKIKSR